jgi:hypothetical protein
MSGAQIGSGSGRFSCELGPHTWWGADLGTGVEAGKESVKELRGALPCVHAQAGAWRLMRTPVGRPPLVQMDVLTVRDATSEGQKLSPCFLR